MDMTLRVFFNGKFRHYNNPDEIIADLTPDEIRESEIAVVLGGEVMGRMESDRLALSAEAQIVGDKILNALTSEDGQVVHDGFTREELNFAFDLVCNPDDWKAEIVANIAVGDFKRVKAAVEFFTATELKIVETTDDTLTVHSVGYRMGPAGP